MFNKKIKQLIFVVHRGGDIEFICHCGKAARIDNPNEQPHGA